MSLLNWPNRISIARTFFVIPFVYFILHMESGEPIWRRLAFVTFVLMALSDVVDGYLARRYGLETALGRFLDPMGDKILLTTGVILLSWVETAVPGFRMPWWVCAIAIGKDVATVAGFLAILIWVRAYFVQPRVLGKACTTLQSGMIAFCLLAPDLPVSLAAAWPAFYLVATAAAVAAAIDYLRLGIRFANGAIRGPQETSA